MTTSPDRRAWQSLFTYFVLAWAPVLVDPGALQDAAALVHLAESPRPYFAPQHAWQLYVWTPLVALSGCFLLWSPGLLLVLALRRRLSFGAWLLYGLGASLVVVGAVTAAVEACLGRALLGTPFALLVLACSVLAAAVPCLRIARGELAGTPLAEPVRPGVALACVGVPWLALAALAPKFHWESFNGDGAHGFESTRLLLGRALPFWDPGVGPIGSFPGVTSMLFAYPGSWSVRLFGPLESAVRLPVLWYLAAVFGGVAALAAQSRAALRASEAWLVWLGLSVYLVAMAFSATYDPYSADLALPATQDTLLVACFLGFVLAFVRGERGWLALFAFLTYVSLPSGLLLVVAWCGAALLVVRPRPWAALGWSALALLACLAFAALLPRALAALGGGNPGAEYQHESLLNRLAFLQFTDLRRLAFVALPCGIAPALGLFVWRGQAPHARALTLVTAAYFGFFFVQAFVSLHHFVPAMLLPLAVFWSSAPPAPGARASLQLAATALLGFVALWLALPEDATPMVHARRVGSAIEMRSASYERSSAEAFRSAAVLGALFPMGVDPRVPDETYGGSPYTWQYYARRPKEPGSAINYVVQAAAEPAPPDMHRLDERDGFALWVKDEALRDEQGRAHLPHPPGSRWLAIDRGLLFSGRRSRPKAPFILDVRAALRGKL